MNQEGSTTDAPDGKCAREGCENDRNPHDWRGECLTCNPYGDSPVMNNDPSYLAWVNSVQY